MTPGRLSQQSEFTPVPSHGSNYICLHDTTTKRHAGASHPAWAHPGCCIMEREFCSGTKSRNGIM